MSAMRFTGYAALFDVRDRGGDVIRAGAFADAAAPLPLLWQHDPARRIGAVSTVREDARGLMVSATIDTVNPIARQAAQLLADGAVTGLSFGYRVKSAHAGPMGRGGAPTRVLTAIDLVEVSLVSSPMQPDARVMRLTPEGV